MTIEYFAANRLNWLPRVDRWAQVVSELLHPGGRLYLREDHPMLLTLADTADGTLRLEYPYFETPEPMMFDESITYTGDETKLVNTRTYDMNGTTGWARSSWRS